MPRYSSGTEDTARQAPTADRRDAPTSKSSVPALSASQFSASTSEGERSYTTSTSIAIAENSMLRTSICSRGFRGATLKNSPAVSATTSQRVQRRSPARRAPQLANHDRRSNPLQQSTTGQ